MAARTGERVLAMDADGHRGKRSDQRGAAPPGLNEVLLGAVKWPDVIIEVGQPHENVSVLLRGNEHPSKTAFERFPSLIDQTRRRYPIILIDGGRVTAGSLLAAGGCCDLAYLIVGLDQTDRSEAVEALAALRDAGVPIRGCIVTHAA